MLHSRIEEALDRGNIVIVPLAPLPNQLTRWKNPARGRGDGQRSSVFRARAKANHKVEGMSVVSERHFFFPAHHCLGARWQRAALSRKSSPRETVSLLQILYELHGC